MSELLVLELLEAEIGNITSNMIMDQDDLEQLQEFPKVPRKTCMLSGIMTKLKKNIVWEVEALVRIPTTSLYPSVLINFEINF